MESLSHGKKVEKEIFTLNYILDIRTKGIKLAMNVSKVGKKDF